MRTATLTRRTLCAEGTFGDWVSDSGFKCFTLEQFKNGDHPRIPEGVYQCSLRYSPKHEHKDFGCGVGMVYGIKDVQGRTDIEIHPANWVEQLMGCVALGQDIKQLEKADKTIQTGITNSRLTVAYMMEDMDGKDFTLTIKEGK